MHAPTRSLAPVALLLLALAAPADGTAALPAEVDGRPLPTLAPMLERVTPAVVNIATRSQVRARENPLLSDPFFRRFFDLPAPRRERRAQSLGSGVIIDAEQGYVVTNHHVVARAREITVTLRDGRALPATPVGADPEADIAVIRVEADDLTALELADSDSLRVGDFVVAIGNPFGLGQTVTSGIVSALGRSGLGIEGYEDFIQTDASINPGNSGGALVNLRGELVGINTAILAPAGGNVGIGFAIPAYMVRELVAQLVEHGEVRRGHLGVVLQDLTPRLAEAFGIETTRGAVVSEVADGSPAQRAGLRPGDVIVTVDGVPLRGVAQLRNIVGLRRIGETVELGILRDGRPLALTLEIAEPVIGHLEGAGVDPRLAGARFSDLGPDHPLRGRVEGVLVSDVEHGSP
ncbi:MAG: Do family serine endopeptidase, partial [Gammaproteobacteria bacterium]|nr:Do family serine endopeptidase [Gammaproteobacteria bacterium]